MIMTQTQYDVIYYSCAVGLAVWARLEWICRRMRKAERRQTRGH